MGKAFRNWFGKICHIDEKGVVTCNPIWDTTNKAVGCQVCEDFREDGWRAALYWVLEDCTLPDGTISRSLIKKELENGRIVENGTPTD